jgi:DNA-binding response OmpR family regulator
MKTVLLAEDRPELREPLAAALRRRGYRVIAAADGREAEEHLGETAPDLTIAEMLLPGRSGLHLTRLVKERTDGKAAVVMLADNVADAHRDYALVLGVDRFLVRPFTPVELLEAVTSLCPPPRPSGSHRTPATARVAGS